MTESEAPPLLKTENVWQLFHHLRHRCIEILNHGSNTHKVDNVLHSVPRDPLLRPRLGENPGRNQAAGTSSTSREKYSVPAAWSVGSSGTWPCTSFRTHPRALSILCPREVLGQGHSDAHPCILQVCTMTSLSSPLRGTNVCSTLSRPHEVHTEKVTRKKGND